MPPLPKCPTLRIPLGTTQPSSTRTQYQNNFTTRLWPILGVWHNRFNDRSIHFLSFFNKRAHRSKTKLMEPLNTTAMTTTNICENGPWPDRRVLNVKLLFDINNFKHDRGGIRRIGRQFLNFKHKIISQNDQTTGRLWKGFSLHSQELQLSLKIDSNKQNKKSSKSDPDATFCSQAEDSDMTFCTQIENNEH